MINKIINQYIVVNYSKIIVNTILVFFSLSIILSLFEEIEFFKNLNESFSVPFILSFSFVPTLILDLFPFIIFLASMFFFLHIKSNKDLLSIKIFGYSNLKITLIVAFFAFILGCLIIVVVNPITSGLVKYYETEKARYSEDIDHLISVNRNGVWIKEVDVVGYKIVKAKKIEGRYLKRISIYIFNENNMIIKRLESDLAEISNIPWIMNNVHIYDFVNNKREFFETYQFQTKKILDKINSLYRNLNTISFVSLIKNYDELNEIGYSKKLLNEQIHKFIALPFFLFVMVVLAAIFTIGTVNPKQNYYYIILSILTSVVIFYFKDLSIALGQTGKVSMVLSVWMPIIIISLFCSIGVIQINEK
jgi:lipopolysaccharide export system permease protein|tara:strand:+ start:1481 stop:2566 length:1086 start_codon:yes stop_codon:yes gene_type:complete